MLNIYENFSVKRILACNDANLKQAVKYLIRGDLIAFPTETVYGLGGNAYYPNAVSLIYHVKSRPAHNPLIIHIADSIMAEKLAEIPPHVEKLIQAHWPGPLTLVLNAKKPSKLAPQLLGQQNSIALRCPAHPIALELITRSGLPLAAPSANISGKLSPTRPQHVAESFKNNAQPKMILTGEHSLNDICLKGIESTIIDARDKNIKILRQGSFDNFSAITDLQADHATAINSPIIPAPILSPILSPGMLESHYAPNAKLRLNANSPEIDELMLGFATIAGDLNLSPTGDLAEAAYHLYDYLHQLDAMAVAMNLKKLSIAPIPMQDLGIAINDRLKRAAYHDRSQRATNR